MPTRPERVSDHDAPTPYISLAPAARRIFPAGVTQVETEYSGVRTNRVTLPGSAAPVVPRAGAVATCNWLVGGPASAHPGKAVAAHPGLTP